MKKLFGASLLSLVLLASTASADFLDIKDNNKNKTAIEYMQDQGIISGYEGNFFKPKKSIRRSELAKIIIKAIEPEDFSFSAYEKECFSDVAVDDWFAPYACYAVEQNWMKAYDGNRFRPYKTITRAEALKVVLSAFCINISDGFQTLTFSDVALDDWYMPYVEIAAKLMLLEEEFGNFYPSKEMDRGYLSQLIYNLIMLKNEHYDIEMECTDEEAEEPVSGEVNRDRGFDLPI